MENFHLLLNKWRAVKTEGKEIPKLSKEGKDKNQIRRWHNRLKDGGLEGFDFSKGISYQALSARQREHAATVCADICEPLVLSPDYRMVVGLGNPSIYETSMTLHHVYGFPYIPATGIKGALRNYVINNYFDLTKEERQRIKEDEWGAEKERRALQEVWFCQMFGCPSGSGRKNSKGDPTAFIGDIVFFDAYPMEAPNIEMDVMTVHYPDYYGEKNLPPADWQSPNPIPFLTVKDNPAKDRFNKFQFVIGLRKAGVNIKLKVGGSEISILDFTRKLLSECLTNHGIGAKTAVGYGYMKPQGK
jgi:CRISPR-associated protein Cmr6